MSERSVAYAVKRSWFFPLAYASIITGSVITGDFAYYLILVVIACYMTVLTTYYFLMPKPGKPMGQMEATARKQIASANLSGRYQGLAETIAVRLGELEADGVSKYSKPVEYEEIRHRQRLLNKIFERDARDKSDLKVANRDDIIQAELLGIVADPEPVTESYEPQIKVIDTAPDLDYVVETGEGARIHYKSLAVPEKKCFECGDYLNYEEEMTGSCSPCTAKWDVAGPKDDLIEDVQTTEQVYRRNVKMTVAAGNPSYTLDKWIKFKENRNGNKS